MAKGGWDAVADVISRRMKELDMTQAELAHRAGASIQTVRELQQNLLQRKRSPRTLAAFSTALGLDSEHLSKVHAGEDPGDPDADDPVLVELDELKSAITTITERLDAIERRLAADGE
ncbi:MAG: XRE family transcriptional regulator [Actinophytocola sp.]|nr:XRE family transcriptional regulator [Actinophytocola sp.]